MNSGHIGRKNLGKSTYPDNSVNKKQHQKNSRNCDLKLAREKKERRKTELGSS